MDFQKSIENFNSTISEEMKAREIILNFIRKNEDVLRRDNEIAHITGSSMIFNESWDKVLMVYHNIYKSWAWTGGHADGEEDLLALSIREAKEETGLKNIHVVSEEIVSLDILPVVDHYKNECYVPPHLHLSVAYVFQASEDEELRIKEDENSGVKWIPISELAKNVTEMHMIPIYNKIIKKVATFYLNSLSYDRSSI